MVSMLQRQDLAVHRNIKSFFFFWSAVLGNTRLGELEQGIGGELCKTEGAHHPQQTYTWNVRLNDQNGDGGESRLT